MNYYLAVKMKLEISQVNITGKWMELEKSFTEWVNPDPKRQIFYVFLLYVNVYLFKPSISVGQFI